MDKDKPKRTSSYEMLKILDQKVKTKKDNPSSKLNDSRKRAASPDDSDAKRTKYNKPAKISETIIEEEVNWDEPDRSLGDLYCKPCDAHMNSEQMWEAHIQGKRHLKNAKNGQQELKYDTVDEEALINSEIKQSEESIVGLQHCCEFQRQEGKPSYQCFMCSANVPNSQLLIEHVIGIKHRMAYLREHDNVKYDLIVKAGLKKGMVESVVAEYIYLHEEKNGSGKMQVKKERATPAGSTYPTYKKPYKDDHRHRRDDRRDSYPDDRSDDSDFRSVAKLRHKSPPYDDSDWRSVSKHRKKSPPYDDYDRRYDYPHEAGYGRDYDHGRDMEYNRRDERKEVFKRPLTPPLRVEPSSSESMKAYPQPSTSSYSSSVEPHRSDDLRLVLEQRKQQEMNRAPPPPETNTNVFESILSVLNALPTMVFLELVLLRVEKMNPTDDEISMLQKIGNHMISLVMNKKLKNLSPDLLSKYQQSVGNNFPQPEPTMQTTAANAKSSSLSDLLSLVSKFKKEQSPRENSTPSQWLSATNSSPVQHEPAFMTHVPASSYSAWRTSPAEIPGLSLTNSTESELSELSLFLRSAQGHSSSSVTSMDKSYSPY